MSTTETNGKSAAKRPRKNGTQHKTITKFEAAKAAGQWLDVVRSTISALIDSVNATRHEALATPGTLGSAIDPDDLRRLGNLLTDADSVAHCCLNENPLNVAIPSALKMFGDQKGGAV